MKRNLVYTLLLLLPLSLFAQSGTNSPYSQWGLGLLSDQTSGFNRGMNGLGYGFHEHNQVNFLNPASYSSIDSLSFIFDGGLSMQITNFEEGGKRVNAKNADFEYLVAGLRLAKHLGLGFGLIPITNVGYNYNTTGYVGDVFSSQYVNTYQGSGGIHAVYGGLGWEPFKGLSIGANVSYVWGTIDRSVVNAYDDETTNTLSKYYSADVRSYKLDFGLQYTARLAKKDWVTIGLTYSPGHKLGADAECKVISVNSQTSVSDTTSYVAENALALPTTFGVGFMWNHHNKLKFGADYTMQRWADVEMPVYEVVNDVPSYTLKKDMFKDRHKIVVGGEYCEQENSRYFFKRLRYRAGFGYSTPYLKINGADGPSEISASFGFGIPIMNGYNVRSLVNVSAQWARQSATGMISENTFRINIGVTFNERWFAKWKVE